mgnify:CR=1 FL=1
MNYLKYSGATICFTLNPYHWSWIPIANRENHFDSDDTFRVSFLFLTIRFWIDNGDW